MNFPESKPDLPSVPAPGPLSRSDGTSLFGSQSAPTGTLLEPDLGAFGAPPSCYVPRSAMANGASKPLAPKKKKRRVWLIVLGIVLSIVAAGAGLVWWYVGHAEGVTLKAEIAVADHAAIGTCWSEVEGSSVEVPCNVPHDFEVFEELYYFAGPYPELYLSAEICDEEFESYVGSSFWTSDYDYTPVRPSMESWEDGNQTGFCVLYLDFQGQASSTARNSGR